MTDAHSILGLDHIEPYQVATVWGEHYSDEDYSLLDETIPSPEVLNWCRENECALIPGPPQPLSLLDVRAIEPARFFAYPDDWYAKEDQHFGHKEKVSPGWMILRKDVVPGSLDKKLIEQWPLLSVQDFVPNAAEMGWFISVYYTVLGIRLFDRTAVRTSSRDVAGNPVDLGHFDAQGLRINATPSDRTHCFLGLAAGRKTTTPSG